MMQFRFSQELIYFFNLFFKLSPKIRRLILVLLDIFCLFNSIFLSFLFTTTRLQDTFFIYSQRYLWIFPATLIFSLIIFTKTGQYKGLTRFVGSIDAYAILLRNLLVIFAVHVPSLAKVMASLDAELERIPSTFNVLMMVLL